MKILLTAINAKYIHSNLAVYSLMAYANAYQKGDAKIAIAEYTINHQIGDILEGIYKAKPDVLCFSCYIWNVAYVNELMREFHKLCPTVPIWVGGPEVSYEADAFLEEHPEVTGVMAGEGEQTFLELCEYYSTTEEARAQSERELMEIAGLILRHDGKICRTGERKAVDMSAIPFCYDGVSDFENRIIYYESSRGCPFRCSYCLSSVEKQLRFRDIELVKKELAFFIDKKVPQVKFVDRTFNCNHAHAMEIWRFIREHDNGISNFHFEISADLLTEEEIALIGEMRPGLIQLEIGVQSTNPATILEIHRTMQLDRLKETVGKLKRGENVHEHLDLIAGLPYEDYDTFADSFDEIYAWKPNQLQLGFLKVLKGSYMHAHADEYGILYRTSPPYEVLQTKWLTYDEVLRLKQVEEMLEVYYNSGQYEMTMKLLETQYQRPFLMYQKLGEFYEKTGSFGVGHSRMSRSRLLLSFVEETAPEALPLIRESLIFDLYYRENLKSRPEWAPEPSEWKQVTRQYCRNKSQSHVERFFYRFPDRTVSHVERLPERENEPLYVWFDYTRRNPLDHQAYYRYVTAGE